MSPISPTATPVLQAWNQRLIWLELRAAGAMLAVLLVIMLTATFSRAMGRPCIQGDEAAIAAMTWATFLGAAAIFGQRGHIAITWLPEQLGPRGARLCTIAINAILFLAAIGFLGLLWRWFDPIGLWQAGSPQAYAQTSFNFLYVEPTMTLGIPRFWIWLILPVVSLTISFHTLVNLIESLKRAPLSAPPAGSQEPQP